jgi:hypothetical protein
MVPSFTTICRRRSRCLPARPSPLQALPPPSTPNQRHLCPHRTVTACRLRPQHRGTPPPASRTCSSLPPPPPRPHRRIRRGAPPICRRSNSSNAQLRRIRPRVSSLPLPPPSLREIHRQSLPSQQPTGPLPPVSAHSIPNSSQILSRQICGRGI